MLESVIRPVLIEGADLTGKSSICNTLKQEGFQIRKYTWFKKNHLFNLALEKVRSGDRVSYEELFIKACDLELEKIELFGGVDFQESSSIVRAFAFAYSIQEFDFVMKLDKLITKYPKFYKVIHLHAPLDARLERLLERMESGKADQTDKLIINDPEVSQRLALGIYYALSLLKIEVVDIDTSENSLQDSTSIINSSIV